MPPLWGASALRGATDVVVTVFPSPATVPGPGGERARPDGGARGTARRCGADHTGWQAIDAVSAESTVCRVTRWGVSRTQRRHNGCPADWEACPAPFRRPS